VEFSFTNLGNDLRTYFYLMMTNCSEEWSFPKLKMKESVKEHHQTKEAEQRGSKE